MIYVLIVWESVRKRDQRVADVLVVVLGDFFSAFIVFVEIFQLYIQYCSLYLVQTAVAAGVFEDVFLLKLGVALCDVLCYYWSRP